MKKIKRKKLPNYLEPQGTYTEFLDKLTSDGYGYVGDGLFSTVYAKDDTHVIKVAHGDKGYEVYLSYVLANQENPYFPRVFDVKRFKNVNRSWGKGDVTVVSMERLEEGPEEKRQQKVAIGAFIKKSTVSDKVSSWRRSLWGDEKLAMENHPVHLRGKHAKQMLDVMRELSDSRDGLDLHDGNIMYRGNQPVIIDPVT